MDKKWKVASTVGLGSVVMVPLVAPVVGAATNEAPQLVEEIGELEYEKGSGNDLLNMEEVFMDPDGDILEGSVKLVSGEPLVKEVRVEDGKVLLDALDIGKVEIEVTVDDGRASVSRVVEVHIVDEFQKTGELADIEDLDETETRRLDNYVSRVEGVEWRPQSSNIEVVDVEVADGVLILTEMGQGEAEIVLEGERDGETLEWSFNVSAGLLPLKSEAEDVKIERLNEVWKKELNEWVEMGEGVTAEVNVENKEIVDATIEEGWLNVKGLKNGTSGMSVKFTNEEGDERVISFDVDVEPFQFVKPFDDQVMDYGDGRLQVVLDGFVNQEDVEFSVEGDKDGIVDVEVVKEDVEGEERSVLDIVPLKKGESEIKVTASLDDGTSIEGAFHVEVERGPFMLEGELPEEMVLQPGRGSQKLYVEDLVDEAHEYDVEVTVEEGNKIVEVEDRGDYWEVTPLTAGESSLTVEWTEKGVEESETIQETVEVEVKDSLEKVRSFTTERFGKEKERVEYELGKYFNSLEGHELAYEVNVSEAVVTAEIENGTLVVEKEKEGTARVKVEAVDVKRGYKEEQTFEVVVEDPLEISLDEMDPVVVEDVKDKVTFEGKVEGFEDEYLAEVRVGNARKWVLVEKGEWDVSFTGEELGKGHWKDVEVNVWDKEKTLIKEEKEFSRDIEVKDSVVEQVPEGSGSTKKVEGYKGDVIEVSLAEWFKGTDDLTYQVTAQDKGIVALDREQGMLDVRLRKQGETDLSVVAENKYGNQETVTIPVEILNHAPEMKTDLESVYEVGEDGLEITGEVADLDADMVTVSMEVNGKVKTDRVDTSYENAFVLSWSGEELEEGTHTGIVATIADPYEEVEWFEKSKVEVGDTETEESDESDEESEDDVVNVLDDVDEIVEVEEKTAEELEAEREKEILEGRDELWTTLNQSSLGVDELRVFKVHSMVPEDVRIDEVPDLKVLYKDDHVHQLSSRYRLQVRKMNMDTDKEVVLKDVRVDQAFSKDGYLLIDPEIGEEGVYTFEFQLSESGTVIKSWDEKMTVMNVKEVEDEEEEVVVVDTEEDVMAEDKGEEERDKEHGLWWFLAGLLPAGLLTWFGMKRFGYQDKKSKNE